MAGSGFFSPPDFIEREPWERGFAQIFASDIAPRIAALERRRWVLIGLIPLAGLGILLLFRIDAYIPVDIFWILPIFGTIIIVGISWVACSTVQTAGRIAVSPGGLPAVRRVDRAGRAGGTDTLGFCAPALLGYTPVVLASRSDRSADLTARPQTGGPRAVQR
jgi:hypothetical protein